MAADPSPRPAHVGPQERAIPLVPAGLPGRKHARAECCAPWVPMLLGLAGCGLVLFLFNPSQAGFYPVCMFHRTTGLLCPGCGSLRALHQLLHGHMATAFRFNPLLMVCLPLVGWGSATYAWRRMTQQPASFVIRPGWLWVFLVVAILFTVWRNLPGNGLGFPE